MAASEAHPFAKTGGLAEIAGALPLALARLGHSVTILVPNHRKAVVEAPPAAETPLEAAIPLGRGSQHVAFHRRPLAPNVTAVLVDAPGLFDRDGLYVDRSGVDYPDNAWRFAVFSRAALEYPRLVRERPSILHVHDWQAGLVPVYQKMTLPSDDPYVGGVPTVCTIHNLAFQGRFPASVVPEIGLPPEVMHIQAMEFWGGISYLKGGINFSEKITTVSPSYAREIVTPEGGFTMDGVLRHRAADLVGILNGIDTERWNPAADQYLKAQYSAADLSGKREAKRALLESAGLPADDAALERPLFGIISRLTEQKGFDLIAAAAAPLMSLDASWVMLGSGESRYEDLLRSMAGHRPDRVSATIGFDEGTAHRIEAGADMFLMPSRFEPCGLNQMYSLRYGTVPIVRGVGGLRDTVRNFDPATGSGTGFVFEAYSADAMLQAIDRALEVFRNPAAWKQIQRAGMAEDLSWDASAREYVKVYRGLMRAPDGI
jgi:starch synthase